jgi:hypothetical protein
VKTVALAAAACVVLAVVTGCGAEGMSQANANGISPAAAPSEPPAKIASRISKFGEQRPAGDSLLVTVSSPRSFAPGDTAYPHSPRAAAFDVTIENQGGTTYRPSQLVVKVSTVDGKRMAPLVDAVQGYSGVMGGEVQPGRATRLTLAFAVPADVVNLVVTVQPNAGLATVTAEFEGYA